MIADVIRRGFARTVMRIVTRGYGPTEGGIEVSITGSIPVHAITGEVPIHSITGSVPVYTITGSDP